MSDIFDLIDEYVEARTALDPESATEIGIPGYDDLLTDHSSAACDERADLDRTYLARLAELADGRDLTEPDRIAAGFMRERVEARLAMHETGEHLRHLSVIGCPVLDVRYVFTIMMHGTDDEWRTIEARMRRVPEALASVRDALQTGIERGATSTVRQAHALGDACLEIAGGESGIGWFAAFVRRYEGEDAALKLLLADQAAAADAAYGEIGSWLGSDYAEAAEPVDGVGELRYEVMAQYYLGQSIDPYEAYEWGWQELDRIVTRARELTEQIAPGATLAQVVEILNVDPRYVIKGDDALQAWLQEFTDQAMESVQREAIDIPEPLLRCEAKIAPAGSAAAQYYTSPSEDFSRPGATWWPTLGAEDNAIWAAVSTWYHESVPGHHLQIGYALLQRERLSRLQRIEFVSGHGEGWALYAERLMGELGFYTEPAYELGYLAAQAIRAARVIVDIGMHLHLTLPDVPLAADIDGINAVGQTWTRDLAVEFIVAHAMQDRTFAESEADRYLGTPAQAISYKLGERAWLAARESAHEAAGDAFDLRSWHEHALRLGPLGLDALTAELSNTAS